MTRRITPLVMPKWGLSMKEGTLAAWHVQEGQTIKPGQEIMDVETDKIANAVEAADGGLLRRAHRRDRAGLSGQGAARRPGAAGGAATPRSTPMSRPSRFRRAGETRRERDHPTEFVETPARPPSLCAASGRAADPIVLIHGFGGDLDNWLFNIDALTDAGPVYALDLPGHGGSTKAIADPWLDALADAVGAVPGRAQASSGVNLVGHSMGGAVAALVALRRPDLVRSLTLISPLGLGEQINGRYIDGFVAAESRRDLKPVLKELFADENLVSRQMVDDLLKFKRLDGVRETLRGLADAMFKDGRQARSLVPDLQAAAIPLQIIWGARDAIIPAAHAKALPQAKRRDHRGRRVIW